MKSKRITTKTKKPWPTKDAMEQIYTLNLWGGNNADYYSGEGSHRPEIVKPYIETIQNFLKSFDFPPVVCDLGCGDFNVGKYLVKYTKRYIGVDIVEGLIKRNQEVFTQDNLTFECLDIATDSLPTADIVLIRQVLQHLSNKEVQSIISKLSAYKYVILTEHLPNGSFEPNKDIISGQGIRLKKQSGLNLLIPPFNLKIKKEKQLLSTSLKEGKEVIVTTLYEMS
ncbi:SAM-dependent methyltransferase, tRNA(uracil-5)-methyltransferase [Galbibacter orientalis DSM 19592]|uniref:SAM-dependent methyltransferase, tRNA(Uracil-5)-methyltransferase n=1 Tax=Galbibacter orientalis DSM 19592 TaxID=926559 RepID=I3C475_9FLAO|nr:SAM-dependent methyltransferase, tRNA(uracil-5)-methyltransferase [Galbibacter orientalis DSM 19592]